MSPCSSKSAWRSIGHSCLSTRIFGKGLPSIEEGWECMTSTTSKSHLHRQVAFDFLFWKIRIAWGVLSCYPDREYSRQCWFFTCLVPQCPFQRCLSHSSQPVSNGSWQCSSVVWPLRKNFEWSISRTYPWQGISSNLSFYVKSHSDSKNLLAILVSHRYEKGLLKTACIHVTHRYHMSF